MNSKSKCLLISPISFYTFHENIVEALERGGYAVDVINEEFPANNFGKALGKVSLPILRWFTLRGLVKRLEKLEVFEQKTSSFFLKKKQFFSRQLVVVIEKLFF